MTISITAMAAALSLAAAPAPASVVRTESYVPVASTAPGMGGQPARLYLREVRLAKAKGRSQGIVLFVHGAGTPAEVSFDVPYKDYSWMAYLARAGFDVFSMDMEGYGRSTRPPPMADPCNLPATAQVPLVPKTIPAVCSASFKGPITTMSSDWTDIGAVVDRLLRLRHAETLALVGWSQGGPRAAGYAAQHPDKISRLVVLAPAYSRDMPTAEPRPLPDVASPMNAQSQAEFKANWDRQAPCTDQYDPAAAASVWSQLQSSDPDGAKWGPGVRRAPTVPSWGFNTAVAAKITTPFLMISGEHDKQVPPDRVRELYADLGAPKKVFIDLACSSHNAMWEKNHRLLFKASLEWLASGTVDGQDWGMMRLGY